MGDGKFVALLVLGVMVSLPAAAATERAYIGTNTLPTDTPNNAPSARGHGEGIYLAAFDTITGKLSLPRLVIKTPSPTWLIFNKTHTVLYAANTYGGFPDPQAGEKKFGSVSAFAVDKTSGRLTLINQVSAGDDPCHLAIDPAGKYLLSANYDEGSIAVLPIRADGGLSNYTDLVRPKGPVHPAEAADNPVRNYAPSDHTHTHIHMVGFDPSGQYAIVNDAGLDNVLVFKATLDHGKLVPVTTFPETPGSAPRHYVFAPDGRSLYDLLEQDSKLAVNNFDPATGHITPRQKLSTLPANFMGSNLTSELLISKDGRHLYAANRLHDTVASFAVATNGAVHVLGYTATGGDYPRSMALDPSGSFLFSMNQYGDSISVFRLDTRTGVPAPVHQWVSLGNPMTMAFLDD